MLVLPHQLVHDVVVAIKIQPGLLVVEAPARIALIEEVKGIQKRDVKTLRHIHNNASNAPPADDVPDLFMFFCTHSVITSLKIRYFSIAS